MRTLLLVGLLLGLGACAGSLEASDQPSPNPRPSTTTVTVAPAGTPALAKAQGGQSGLAGQIFAASDVSGLPDEPLPDQLVLAVPVEKAGEILGVSGDRLAPEALRFLKASLSQAHPSMSATLSDAAGNYTLLVDPGEVILCVADSEGTPPDFPATTRGCGLIEVRPEELRQVDISSGFGEILLVER